MLQTMHSCRDEQQDAPFPWSLHRGAASNTHLAPVIQGLAAGMQLEPAESQELWLPTARGQGLMEYWHKILPWEGGQDLAQLWLLLDPQKRPG